MSAKKVFDTKIHEDENTDSGFLSGPLSEQLLSSEDLATDTATDKESVSKVNSDAEQQVDSGLDLCLSECLSNVEITDSTPTAKQQLPTITVGDEKNQDIPPLAILFQQDDDGDTQLHIAAVHGCEKSVSTLIKVCPYVAWLNIPNDYGHTALHLSVLSGHAVVTRMLVRAGASLLVRDLSGDTPIHIATSMSHLECLQALLAPVPEHQPRKLSAALNQKNYNGQTCVHIAAAKGHIETMQTLYYYGADINAREGLAGWTPLHVAARRGDARLAALLLERGAAARARDYAGRTPRRLAARSPAAAAFAHLAHHAPDTDSDTDSEDDSYDSDSESLFEMLSEQLNPINVA